MSAYLFISVFCCCAVLVIRSRQHRILTVFLSYPENSLLHTPFLFQIGLLGNLLLCNTRNVVKNTYLHIDTDATVSYELPINIQRNFAYTPTIYLVEQKNLCNYPIRYTAVLNSEIPYLIEASVKTEKNGITYSAETADDYYFVFCTSEKPQSPTFPNNSNGNTTLIICCSVIGGIAFIALIVLIGIAIHQKVKR